MKPHGVTRLELVSGLGVFGWAVLPYLEPNNKMAQHREAQERLHGGWSYPEKGVGEAGTEHHYKPHEVLIPDGLFGFGTLHGSHAAHANECSSQANNQV